MAATDDPIAAEVFRHLFISVAEEMGAALERAAYSPNIKERRDYSCALFDPRGRLVEQAAHIPVHLGAFPLLMEQVVPAFRWSPGDLVISNDPQAGGTHLPDISVVSPVFTERGRLAGFVANRAHHADVGGAHPGSMAPATEIYQEGLIIPPVQLFSRGKLNAPLLDLLLRNVRTPEERRGDLEAQFAANAIGARRFRAILDRYTPRTVHARIASARAASLRAVRTLLAGLPSRRAAFRDFLDDDGEGSGPIAIEASLQAVEGRLIVDFTASADQQRGSINATRAVTHAAVYYALLCLLPDDVAVNAGTFEPVEVRTRPGSVVDARGRAAVAAGNVETSQRIVDVVLGALAQLLPDRIPAASQGTMNNLAAGGVRPGTGTPWAYYETLGGGAGASPARRGISGAHVHMSNTRNTPAEALEYHYPLRVRSYAVRAGSGGAGSREGGEGVIRELEFLAPAAVTLLTERRHGAPYGLAGGSPGAPGTNELLRGPETASLPPKLSLEVRTGDRIRLSTPGGGGHGGGPG